MLSQQKINAVRAAAFEPERVSFSLLVAPSGTDESKG
jgi:hypothetical protein